MATVLPQLGGMPEERNPFLLNEIKSGFKTHKKGNISQVVSLTPIAQTHQKPMEEESEIIAN